MLAHQLLAPLADPTRQAGWRSSVRSTDGVVARPFIAQLAPLKRRNGFVGAKQALRRDLLALARDFNRSGDGTMAVPSEYLEVVIHKR
jgi:hypothetical protein